MSEDPFEAARAGDAGSLAVLLDQNPEGVAARTAPYGWTLLHAAAASGSVEAVDVLLARGADVNVRDVGDNAYPMHWAAGGGHWRWCGGWPTRAATWWGMATTTSRGHAEVVRVLLEAGADTGVRDDRHDSDPLGWAEHFGRPATVELLRDRPPAA